MSVSKWLTWPCLYDMVGRLPSTADVSISRSYYSELAMKRCLGGNDGLSSGGNLFVVVNSPSSGTVGLRARSMATVGRDLCPSKASVEWCSHRAPAQETTELAL
ncbi:hypothetical protein Acr_00g0080080 [Actinidia rufa]|uniref:Uncharacterized protein n=1 Tax=Actinidia rufa TaxID=165716 RepID=A0A7J0DUJ5_9ERIC|nr:hypothetical protein Acr_00g0080080 [Actinidia rufa]